VHQIRAVFAKPAAPTATVGLKGDIQDSDITFTGLEIRLYTHAFSSNKRPISLQAQVLDKLY